MAREETDIAGRRRKGGRVAPAAVSSPRGPRKALASTHPLPEDRALLLHLIRALAREAARADHEAERRQERD